MRVVINRIVYCITVSINPDAGQQNAIHHQRQTQPKVHFYAQLRAD